MTGADHQSRHLLGAGSEGRIYSIASPLPPIANKKALNLANQGLLFGAGEMNRTPDLLITNELLYRLSYTGEDLDYSAEW